MAYSPNDFLIFLREFRKRPAMFMGAKSISRLEAYMAGWLSAATEIKDIDLYVEFTHEWIPKHYKGIPAEAGWFNMLFVYGGGDYHGVDLFFEHFDKFMKNRHPEVEWP